MSAYAVLLLLMIVSGDLKDTMKEPESVPVVEEVQIGKLDAVLINDTYSMLVVIDGRLYSTAEYSIKIEDSTSKEFDMVEYKVEDTEVPKLTLYYKGGLDKFFLKYLH